MDLFQKEFINIIQSAFSFPKDSISPEFDWDKAIDTAKKHNIVAAFYYGALNCGADKTSQHMTRLFSLTCRSLMISEPQMYETERITAEFEKENIEYMPLKGMVLKTLYPKPEMRTMGDADILIKLEQYGRIEEIMKKLGFEYQRETDHEYVWHNNSLLVELHKSVITSYNKDFYEYFGSGWKVAHNISGTSRYEMSIEDFYIYIFVHFTKHYRVSGIGIKHLLDLWVFSEKHPELNRDYIADELKKMNLYTFYGNILNTIDAWFNKGTDTDITDFITNVLFDSGQYGSGSKALVSRSMRDNSGSVRKRKLSMFLKRMFLPYREMKNRYSILAKLPFLLPIMWIVRWFELAFCRKHIVKKYMSEMKLVNQKSIDEKQFALDFVGLNFDSDESKNS